MEDEEYYHMMLDDMERLERIHHHNLPSLDTPISPQAQQERLQSPWISGLRVAFDAILRSGLERFHLGAAWHERKGDNKRNGS
jgi:hypothetical protein